jgi:ketosteroid isomerase-like protein
MKPKLVPVGGLLFAALLGVAVAGQQDDDAMQLARKLTNEGASTFNTLSAKAMAAFYTDDAKIFLETKNEDGLSVKEYNGRDEIEELYEDLFKDRKTVQSKNTVEYARLLAPDLLVIAGVFEPDLQAKNPLKVPFYQVRIKQGEKWVINSLRIFVVGGNS